MKFLNWVIYSRSVTAFDIFDTAGDLVNLGGSDNKRFFGLAKGLFWGNHRELTLLDMLVGQSKIQHLQDLDREHVWKRVSFYGDRDHLGLLGDQDVSLETNNGPGRLTWVCHTHNGANIWRL